MIMSYKNDYQLEMLMALKALGKIRSGECPEKAEAAKKVLEDQKLFNEFVQLRLERRAEKKIPKKVKKELTWWKRCVNFICRKA